MRDETNTWAAWKVQGSREALVALLEARRNGVYNLCYQVVRHVQDAEDAAQKVLLELLDHLPELTDEAHLRRWLHRTGLHVSLKVLRSRRRRMEHEAKKARQTGSGDSPVSSEEREALHEHLAALDGEDQSLIVDHYFQRKSLSQLAQEQGVSTAAVWKKMERARGRLKAALSLSGLAAAWVRMESSLDAIEIARPPAGPLSPAVLAKASAAAGGGGAALAAAIGGTAMKGKSLAITMLIGLCAAGGVGLATWPRLAAREARPAIAGRDRPRPPADSPDLPARVVMAETDPSAAAQGPGAPLPTTFSSVDAFIDAFVAACAITDDGERWQALRALGVRLSDEDFGLALAEARRRAAKGSKFERSLVKTVLQTWSMRDPKGHLSVWLRIPDVRDWREGEAWKDVVVPTFRSWGKQDPAAVLEFIQAFPYVRGHDELAELAWGMADPDTYFTTLLKSASDGYRAGKLEFAIRTLAAKDAAAALTRLDEVPDPIERRRFTSAAFGEIAKTDLEKAIVLSRDIPDPETRDGVVASLVHALARSDAARAVALAESVVEERRRVQALGDILSYQAWQDPARVPELIRGFPAPAIASRATDIARAWATADPRAAMAWALALPDSEETRVPITDEARTYEITAGEHAAGKVIDAWAAKEPRAALQWISSSSFTEDGRRRLREAGLSSWGRRDRKGAIAWVSESALPADEKAALIRILRR